MAEALSTMELGRRLVARLAPDELPLFDQTWQALGSRPRWRSRRREEPLGFGVPGMGEVLVTAVASGVATCVVKDLATQVGSRWARVLTRFRRRPAKGLPNPLPPLTAERLRQIRTLAYRKARKLGMPEATAHALADAVVSELATAKQQSQ